MASKQKDVKDVQIKAKENDVNQENPSGQPDDTQEYQIKIAEAAYYIAEKRGFTPDHEMDDWLEAEREVTGKTEKS